MKRLKFSLQVTLPLLLLCCAAIAGAISWQINTRLLGSEIESQFLAEAKLRIVAWQTTIEYLFRKGDVDGVNLQVSGMATRDDVIAGFVLDPHDRILVATRRSAVGHNQALIERSLPQDLKGLNSANLAQVRGSGNGSIALSRNHRLAVAYYPLSVDFNDHALRSTRSGFLVVVFDTHIARARAFQAAGRQALDNAFVFAGLAAWGWVFIHFSLSRRVAGLVATTRRFASGDLTARTGMEGVDELAQVAQAFDLMADRIAVDVLHRKAIEEKLRRQQNELRVLFDYIPAMVAFKDTKDNILRANQRLADTLGKSVAEIEGKPAAKIFPRQAARFYLDDLEVIRSNTPKLGIIERFYDRDEKELWIQTDKVPVCDTDGEVIGLVAMAQDITGRRAAEREILFNEQRYRSLVEATTAIVWDTPASGEFETPQPGWTAFTGQSFEELRGWGWLNAIHPDDRSETARIWSAAVASRSHYVVEHRMRARDRLYRHMMVRAVPILAEDGAILQWIGIHVDITEQKRAEEDLRWKTAFLEAQVNSSIDGILVVDGVGTKILQNQRLTDLLKIPQHIADDKEDEDQLRWVTDRTKNPVQFIEQVVYLNSHPNEVSRDEIELTDGMTLDRYSSPVIGLDGKYFGRIWTFRDVTERKRTEESLRLLSSAMQQSKESITITDGNLDSPGPKIIFVNPAFTKMTGYTVEEVIGKTPRILQGPHTDKAVLGRLRENLQRGEAFAGETINYRKDGTEFNLEWQIAPICDLGGKITHFVAIQHDITERKQLEARLYQSQKMETVGKLAGGIAHEFNSILTAIIGQSELLLGDLPAGSPLAKKAAEISQAAARAATLTRQLLAYGRKQTLHTEVLDLNSVLTGMEATLLHLMTRSAEVRIAPATGLKAVLADAGQIEQVIMNMALNARDAMPNGGKLTLETANVSLDQASADRDPDLKPGDYVMLAISDTGTGMTEELKARAFDPFFTTKGIGQGTGLGLSTCYGIIKQSGGHISVHTELGQGATFKIYLPQVESRTKLPARSPASPDLPRGTESILLVEDDPDFRQMAATLLRRLGYTVATAGNGLEALTLSQQNGNRHIDLLLTDVVMPNMSGSELADRVRAINPGTRILFASAYTENAIVHQSVLDENAAVLQKPFTPSALAHKLREVLDRPIPSTQAPSS